MTHNIILMLIEIKHDISIALKRNKFLLTK